MSIRKMIVFVLVLVACSAPSRGEADPLAIHIGWAQAPGHLAPLFDVLAKKHPEVMPYQGKSYDAVAIHFGGSTPQIQAMAAGELEIAAFAPSSLTLAIANAGLDVRVVSDVIQDGLPGYYDEPFIVKKDGPIARCAGFSIRKTATRRSPSPCR